MYVSLQRSRQGLETEMWPVIHDFEYANYYNPYKTSYKAI